MSNATIEEISARAEQALRTANTARCGDWKAMAKLPTIAKHLAIDNQRLVKALNIAWKEEIFYASDDDVKIELILQGEDE